jgi:hypothetical protein
MIEREDNIVLGDCLPIYREIYAFDCPEWDSAIASGLDLHFKALPAVEHCLFEPFLQIDEIGEAVLSPSRAPGDLRVSLEGFLFFQLGGGNTSVDPTG